MTRARTFATVLIAATALSGCTAIGGYGGLSVGYGGGYYDDGYYDDGYYGDPYYGWYDNYYYPGTGIYVYDSYRRPHAMSDSQKRYWTERQQRVTSPTTTTTTTRDRRTARRERPALRENWSAFKTKAATTTSSDRRAKRDRTRD